MTAILQETLAGSASGPAVWVTEAIPDTASFVAQTRLVAVESSPGWLRNLQETVFTGGCAVRYVVHQDGGELGTFLPLRYERQGRTRWICSLSNYYTSLYEPLLFSDRAHSELAECLRIALADAGGADAMRFAPMDYDGRAFLALTAAIKQIGWLPFRYFCFGNWYLRVESSWAEYLLQREGALRNTIKRKGKKFTAAGGRLDIVTAGDGLDAAIEAYNAVYRSSWKKPEPFPEFVPGLVRWLADSGQLRMGIASLAERPIAAQIWFVKGGKASIFKLAYDEEFADLGAGTLLTAHLMEHVIDGDRVKEVDYLIGDDPYKKSWMSARRERWGLIAYNPRSIRGLALLTREVAAKAAKRIAVQGRELVKAGRRLLSMQSKQAGS